MAASNRSGPGRLLALVGIVLVALYLPLALGKSSNRTPALGLDLRGGTEVTLTAHSYAGGKVSKTALNQAVDIIRKRANGLGVGGAQVSTQGSNNILVAVPGQGRDQVVRSVGQTALLRFRQVEAVSSAAPSTLNTASPSPSATSSKAGGKTGSKGAKGRAGQPKASSSPKRKSSHDALSAVLLKPAAKKTPTPTPSATPTAAVATPLTTGGATPTPGATPTSTPTPQGVGSTPLPNAQSPTLTAAFETAFATWDCTNPKTNNPTQGDDNPSDYIIACSQDGSAKYLLGPAKVQGTQVKGANASLDNAGVNWTVNLTFNGAGSSAWYTLTKTAYEIDPTHTSTTCGPPKGCNGVAIVLDGVVQSAPYISSDGIPGGNAQITGGFSQKSANDLADILKYGALPLRFDIPSVSSVSATLGSAQLRGGLIAGAIGLALVIVFSLLYYRALGLVTIGSLAVSGALLYAVTTLLGHSALGYTLSLPGIAGFIVAVGITADSFVVFFERLRDEVREGRRLRSAVDKAWPRARRTIISADSVSLLAAVILYVVSIGDVRGFAFTLGLSTLSDLFIVFCFTKPLVTVLARRRAFDTGASWTGIGRARAGVVPDVDAPPIRARRPREV